MLQFQIQIVPTDAWKRSRLVDRELAKLAEKIKPHMAGKTHQEACDAMLDEMYVSQSAATKNI